MMGPRGLQTLAALGQRTPPGCPAHQGPGSCGPALSPTATPWPDSSLPVAIDNEAGSLKLVPRAQLSQQVHRGLLVAPLKVALGHLRTGLTDT